MSEPVFDESEINFNRIVSFLLIFVATLLVGLGHMYGIVIHWMLPFIFGFFGFLLYIMVRQSETEMQQENSHK